MKAQKIFKKGEKNYKSTSIKFSIEKKFLKAMPSNISYNNPKNKLKEIKNSKH
jgi:hypothetical protein